MTNRKTNRIVALFVALAALVVLCFALTGSSRSQAKAGPAYVETVAETSDWQDPDYPVTLCPKEQKPGTHRTDMSASAAASVRSAASVTA